MPELMSTSSFWLFVAFGLVPFLFALFSEKWFWKLPLVSKVWKCKTDWDQAEIVLPRTRLPLKALREISSIGSKTTVAHHLAYWANDVRVRLLSVQVRGAAIVGIGWVLTVVPVAAPPQGQNTFGYLALQFFATYTLPVAGVSSLFEAFTLLWGLYDQLRKYEDLLDPNRIARRAKA